MTRIEGDFRVGVAGVGLGTLGLDVALCDGFWATGVDELDDDLGDDLDDGLVDDLVDDRSGLGGSAVDEEPTDAGADGGMILVNRR